MQVFPAYPSQHHSHLAGSSIHFPRQHQFIGTHEYSRYISFHRACKYFPPILPNITHALQGALSGPTYSTAHASTTNSSSRSMSVSISNPFLANVTYASQRSLSPSPGIQSTSVKVNQTQKIPPAFIQSFRNSMHPEYPLTVPASTTPAPHASPSGPARTSSSAAPPSKDYRALADALPQIPPELIAQAIRHFEVHPQKIHKTATVLYTAINTEIDFEEFRKIAEFLHAKCAVCWITPERDLHGQIIGYKDGVPNHNLSECRHASTSVDNAEYRKFRITIEFPGRICFACGVPILVRTAAVANLCPLIHKPQLGYIPPGNTRPYGLHTHIYGPGCRWRDGVILALFLIWRESKISTYLAGQPGIPPDLITPGEEMDEAEWRVFLRGETVHALSNPPCIAVLLAIAKHHPIATIKSHQSTVPIAK